MEAKNIAELIALIAEVTPLTPGAYPALKELTGKNAETFIIGHSLRHLSVSTGYMQKFIEHAEHGDAIDKEALKKKLFSAQFSIFKLCSILAIDATELCLGVEKLVIENRT